jgi:hypothetical protein
MKKLLALGFALFCLSACSGDDSSEPSVNLDQLAKRWYYVSSKIGGQTIPYAGNLSCGKDYMEFLTSNTVKDVDYYDCQEDPDVATGTYTAVETTLTTNINGESITYTIKKLNSKALETETTFNGTTIRYIFTSTP